MYVHIFRRRFTSVWKSHLPLKISVHFTFSEQMPQMWQKLL